MPRRRNSKASAGKIFNSLAAQQTGPEDVEGVYRVSQLVNCFSVQFGFEDTDIRVASMKTISTGGTEFDIMKLDKPVV